MDLEKIKNEVIYSDNPSRLFEITIELTEEISKLYVSLGYTDDHKTKNELKGKISLLSTLQNIIDKRIEDVRTTDKVNERQELLSNRQFRIASQMVLKKETYERIVELSLLNYKKLKDQKNELKANKLEWNNYNQIAAKNMFVGEKVYNWNGTRWDLTCTEKWYYSEPKELNIVEINGKNINIYPNPTNGILFIECESFSTIKLYNMLGKDVLTQTANGKTEINISHLPNGICNVIIF